MKVQFDIKYRPQIESGKYKVILDCGVEAEILAWDKPGKYPIVCMAKKEDAIPFKTDNSGIAYHYPEGSNYSDLFIITPEPELSEFEQSIVNTLSVSFGVSIDNETANVLAKKLLDLARKELVKQGYVIEKKAFHDAAEKVSPEVIKEVSENIGQLSEFEFALRNAFADTSVLTDGKNDEEQSEIADKQAKRYAPELLALAEKEIAKGHEHDVYIPEDTYYEQLKKQWEEGYDNGKAEVLKDLPRWENVKIPPTEIAKVWVEALDSFWLQHKNKQIHVQSLEKLPGFKEE